jgi:hypothetical protein
MKPIRGSLSSLQAHRPVLWEGCGRVRSPDTDPDTGYDDPCATRDLAGEYKLAVSTPLDLTELDANASQIRRLL